MKILDIQKSKDMKYLLQKLSMFTFSCTKIESNATEKKKSTVSIFIVSHCIDVSSAAPENTGYILP